MMTSNENILVEQSILSQLNEKALCLINNKLTIHPTIDSTNLEAHRLLKCDARNRNGTVILAEHQTAGRGRLGRSFYSPMNSGIYVTVIYTPEKKKSAGAITISSAVAIKKVLSDFGFDVKIKWVNDIFVHNKKVCGILAEGFFTENKTNSLPELNTYIVGIGINVFDSLAGFPSDIKNIAGSLNKKLDRNILVAKILNSLVEMLDCELYEIIDEYKNCSIVLNKKVTVIKVNETYSATALDITDEGHLVVQRADGKLEELLSGEVSLKI